MSIAALGSSWLLSLAANALTGAAANKASSANGNGGSDTGASMSVNFGDAYQLSLSTAATIQPPPKPDNGGIRDYIGDFLAKVAGGTATSSDMEQLRDKLQQAAQNWQARGHQHHHGPHGKPPENQGQAGGVSQVGADLRAFLEKLVKGTATEEDFKNIEAEIQAINTSTGSSTTPNSASGSSDELLRVTGIPRALLNSAMHAYNNQAYFNSPQA